VYPSSYDPGVSFLRGLGDSSSSSTAYGARTTPVHEERRRSIRSGHVATGTLACSRCDAPVAIGPEPLAISDELMCPFCAHAGTVRDFLSLRTPTRPARVVVRIAFRRS
jgi:hypothetical protein